MTKFKDSKEEFMKKRFITCKNCGYNNERSRFLQYGTCLNCSEILDEKVYFKIEMLKKINMNKRKSR